MRTKRQYKLIQMVNQLRKQLLDLWDRRRWVSFHLWLVHDNGKREQLTISPIAFELLKSVSSMVRVIGPGDRIEFELVSGCPVCGRKGTHRE